MLLGAKKALLEAKKRAPQSTIFCTMISMAEASRANRRPPNPLPTLPLPPTHHRHHCQRRRPTPRRLLPDNDKCRSATTTRIATAIVNDTAPILPLHQPLPPRRRLRPLHGLSNERIGRGRNLTSSRPRGQKWLQWLRQAQWIGEGICPGKGKGGRWTLMGTIFRLAEC